MADSTWALGTRRRKSIVNGVSRTEAMAAIGAVVYAARLADGKVKIGWTERFDLRLHWLKHYVKQDVELLAFRVGTYEDEQALHELLAPHRALGVDYLNAREYYEPTNAVMVVVNEMRTALGLAAA